MIWREGKRERVIEGGKKEGLRARRKKAEKVGKEEGEEERKEEGKGQIWLRGIWWFLEFDETEVGMGRVCNDWGVGVVALFGVEYPTAGKR